MKLQIFDSTLRDGAQGENVNYSVEDKLNIVKTLDELGVDYIEAGNPGSNPKDGEFFERLKGMKLTTAKPVAFGSTRRPGTTAAEDTNCRSLLKAETPAVAIFGKSWDLHVTEIIRTTLEENLAMITDTVAFFKSRGKTVIYDAEHFFDGYKSYPGYAIATLKAAVKGGADVLALCETNGGCLPDEVYVIVRKVMEAVNVPEFSPKPIPVGIHCHDDSGCGVANSIMAVLAGAVHVQGTYVGYGERCGNANLAAIIANLQIKRGYECIPPQNMANLTRTARVIAEITNRSLPKNMPYVGRSAFAHKAGMHIDGVNKASHSFEHVAPAKVGNERRFLMSEVAGRGTVVNKIGKIAPALTKDSPEVQRICGIVKQLEHEGYQFEAAEASFELMVMRELGMYRKYFDLDYFKTVITEPSESIYSATAMIKISVDDTSEVTASEGDGPVHALDNALRRALEVFYPQLKSVRLTDYKVRVLDPQQATGAKVRVLIESTDDVNTWSTVGVSTNVIDASWKALVDGIEYKLIVDERKEHFQ